MEEAVEAGEEALPRLQDAALSKSKQLSLRLKKAIGHWHLGMMDRLEEASCHALPCLAKRAKRSPQVVEAQDLERLEELIPWIERSGLQQRPDAQGLLRHASAMPFHMSY